MLGRRILFVVLAIFGMAWEGSARAAADQTALRVGTSEFSPMSMARPDGTREGFDIDVMNEVAKRVGRQVTYRTYDFDELIPALERGEIDAAISGMTITQQRETRVDFTHPYLETGLTVMVDASHVHSSSALGFLMTGDFWLSFGKVVLVLTAVCFIGGFLLWASNRNIGALAKNFFPGMGDGMWLTLVTGSTVGYGDIAPKGWKGRLVGAVVILLGVTAFSMLTGLMSSSMTLQRLESDIDGIRDLRGKKVATVRNSTSVARVRDAHAVALLADDELRAIAMLREGTADAVVFDATALQYQANLDTTGSIVTVGGLFDKQSYGIALQSGSTYREAINQALLAMRGDEALDRIHAKWLGEDASR